MLRSESLDANNDDATLPSVAAKELCDAVVVVVVIVIVVVVVAVVIVIVVVVVDPVGRVNFLFC